jgi:N-acetylneuraminate lyase
MFKLERLVSLHPDKLLFSGADECLMSGIGVGAIAAIGTTYNLVGPLAIKIFNAVSRGDLATARAGQGRLNEFIEAYFKAGSLQAFKMAAAQLRGWECGKSPAPAVAASPEAVAIIINAANAALRAAREIQS